MRENNLDLTSPPLSPSPSGGTRTKAASELTYARQTVVSTSRAFDLAAIDLVDIDYRDLDGLRTQAEEGARLGFSGKQASRRERG